MISKPNKSLLGQFYQRKVMRVGFAYVLIGWILMQVGEVGVLPEHWTNGMLGFPPTEENQHEEEQIYR